MEAHGQLSTVPKIIVSGHSNLLKEILFNAKSFLDKIPQILKIKSSLKKEFKLANSTSKELQVTNFIPVLCSIIPMIKFQSYLNFDFYKFISFV